MVRTGAARFFGLLPAVMVGLALAGTPVAFAHVLKTDAGMNAELHIEPDDAPVTNTPVTYRLEFNETAGTFSTGNCNCSIAFIANGHTLGRQTLAATTSDTSVNTFTFSKAADYTFRVSGAPKNGTPFAAFTIDYPVHVGKAASSQGVLPLMWWGIGAAVALMIVIAVVNIFRRRRDIHAG